MWKIKEKSIQEIIVKIKSRMLFILYDDSHHEYSFLRAAPRNGLTDVTSTVNSVQAPSRHTRASA